MNKETNLENTDEFCKNVLTMVMRTIRCSNGLPHDQDDFDLYSSFPGFRNFLQNHATDIIKVINQCFEYEGLNKMPGVLDHSSMSQDEKMEQLVESNDVLLEQVSMLLDEEIKAMKNKDKNSETFKPVPIKKPETVVSSWNRKSKSGSSQTFKLFHAHNILRPQLKFKDKIDNTSVPFVPKITYKPNAIKPLPSALVDLRKQEANETSLEIASLVRQGRNYSEEESKIYDHPYEEELGKFKPSKEQLETIESQLYKPFPQDPCDLITSKDELLQIVEELKLKKEIAVDLEHHSYRSFQGITCLIQISTRQRDYLIDALHLRSELDVLNEVFTDPTITKVFHGADSDVLWLQRDFGVYIVNLFDTGQASRELNFARNSFDFLLKKYIGLNANKKYQLADWRIRPLPTEMRKYAQEDTHYLLYIYDLMRNELLECGQKQGCGDEKLKNVYERSKQVCLRKYEKQLFREDGYLKFYEKYRKKNMTPPQLEMLRLLYNWRDAIARQDDESTGYVLPNHMMFQIADIMPKEAQGVLACCNPVPPLIRQNVQTIHQMVIEARTKSYQRKSTTNKSLKAEVKKTKLIATYEDILTCPHDMTHVTENAMIYPELHEKATIEVKPKLYLQNEVHHSKPTQLRAKKFPDPFYKFLPNCKKPESNLRISSQNNSNKNLTFRDFIEPNFIWRLKAPPKPVKQEMNKTKKPNPPKQEPEFVLKYANNPVGQQMHHQSTKRKSDGRVQAAHKDFQPYEYNKASYERFDKTKKKRHKRN